MSPSIELSTQLQRKSPQLPVYVVVPGQFVQSWNLRGTTVVEGSANGHAFGRRTLKAWGKGSDDWFMELTAAFCKTAALSVGDRVQLKLQRVDTSTPEALATRLADNRHLTRAWQALTESERRNTNEHIRAAKTQATQEKRAAQVIKRLMAKEETQSSTGE